MFFPAVSTFWSWTLFYIMINFLQVFQTLSAEPIFSSSIHYFFLGHLVSKLVTVRCCPIIDFVSKAYRTGELGNDLFLKLAGTFGTLTFSPMSFSSSKGVISSSYILFVYFKVPFLRFRISQGFAFFLYEAEEEVSFFLNLTLGLNFIDSQTHV